MLHFPADMWTAGATYAAWLFGFSSLILNGFGLVFIFRSLKATEIAAETSTASADAAREAVHVSRASLRAYVVVTRVAAQGPIANHEGEQFILVHHKNCGQSVASGVDHFGSVVMWPKGQTDFEIRPVINRAKSAMYPGETRTVAISFSIPKASFEDWVSGACDFWCFGEFRYVDTFGVDRVTTYRYRLPPEGVGREPGEFLVTEHGGNDIL